MYSLMFLMFPNPLPLLLLLPFAGWVVVKYPSRKADAWLLMSLATVPLSLAVLTTIGKLSCLAPVKYDQYFYLMDLRLGDPSYTIGVFLAGHPICNRIIQVIYNLLPYEVIAIFGANLWRTSLAEAGRSLWAYFLMYSIILPLYLIFPAAGPGLAFPGFPYIHPAIVVPHVMALRAAPNCMPSGHFAQALLTIWLARKWRVGVVLSVLFAALTGVATLGLGEHYVIDLVAAVPYSALIAYVAGAGAGVRPSIRSWRVLPLGEYSWQRAGQPFGDGSPFQH
jgi:hypothetical protein